MIKPEQYHAIEILLGKSDHSGPFTLEQIKGGANNRAFLVKTDGIDFFLKLYFRHPDDPRDRLNTEFMFLSLLWENNIRVVPKPLSFDEVEGIALYEFIAGRSMTKSEIMKTRIQECIDFFTELNQLRGKSAAIQLPFGSEACFSIQDHVQMIENRVQRLKGINESMAVNKSAIRFVHEELLEAWREVRNSIQQESLKHDIDTKEKIPSSDRCISPSDFGFHNAILADKNNLLLFVDFEYSGWDDPAKLVCDFFCQPKLPVYVKYFNYFSKSIATQTAHPDKTLQRINLLMPGYKIKWCCIILNEFLPLDNYRRDFTGGNRRNTQSRDSQLQKAREMLKDLNVDFKNINVLQ